MNQAKIDVSRFFDDEDIQRAREEVKQSLNERGLSGFDYASLIVADIEIDEEREE